jgi:hypothetical protein
MKFHYLNIHYFIYLSDDTSKEDSFIIKSVEPPTSPVEIQHKSCIYLPMRNKQNETQITHLQVQYQIIQHSHPLPVFPLQSCTIEK